MRNLEATIPATSASKRHKRNQRYSRGLLYGIFFYGRFLDVVNCSWDHQRRLVLPASKAFKFATSLFRVSIVIAYGDVIPQLALDFITNPRSFVQLFAVVQVFSVAVFSIGLFWMKMRDEFKLIQLMNRFIELNNNVVQLMNKNFTLCNKFLIMCTLKSCITLLGYINEMPNLFDVEGFTSYRWLNVIVGAYLWLGSMFMMDGCYMGFLVLSLMYHNLGKHLHEMLDKMKHIEAGSLLGASYTPYYRMRLLCDYSEQLDAIDRIYSRLFRVTKDFVCIFQWNILYYIYYNFMVIFLLLNYCIWQYLQQGSIDFLEIFFIFVKISNLTMMIMAANNVVEQSEVPNQLNLDVICSDIDVRWDTSVESFICQRKVENLEITVFGFFELNNEFILLMLSAIITYMFFIIQFGMAGGFGQKI